ncbi:uncharacterized protein LOC107472585 [Arachis duranensis]|uniref:Uncharacterized protein LOC107472585 n=1 Tax=Arachis duranensis TaxID=130453 RepID=A0A6P4C8E2_ARADU|nr:uncharacterized protein LOC107472585 [Arachis duranensis]
MKEYEQSSEMNYFPEPQSDSNYYGTYTKDGWEGKCNDSYSNYLRTLSLDRVARAYLEECSSFDYASTQNSLQDPYNSSHQPQNYSQPLSFELVAEDPLQKSRELLERQEQIMEEQKQRWTEQEFLLKKTEGHVEQRKIHSGAPSVKDDEQSVSEEEEEEVPISIEISMEEEQDEEATVSSELSMKNKVVENEIALEMTREHKDSQLSQTFLTQQLSTLESMIERYEEEMKKAWEDQQTSSMKELLKQMLSVKEEGEEQASEEDNQERPNSRETEREERLGQGRDTTPRGRKHRSRTTVERAPSLEPTHEESPVHPFITRGNEHSSAIRHHGPQTQHARTNSPPHALERAGKRKHTGVPSQLRWAGFGGSDEEHSRDSPRREVLRAIIEQPHRLRLSNPHS